MRPQNAILYYYQSQDLELLRPIAQALKGRGWGIFTLIDPRLNVDFPRARALLEGEGFKTCVVSSLSLRLISFLFRSSALLTACDTTAGPHRRGRRLARLCRLVGIRTFTLQHGLENIGLTYYDDEYPPEFVDFASDVIFIWGPLSALDSRVPEKIKRRCVAVGCPKDFRAEQPGAALPIKWEKLVVVFENLHWRRYSESYKNDFLSDLEAAATFFPAVTFLVRPHPSGRWLASKFKGRRPSAPNLVITDPRNQAWAPVTAAALIRAASAVVTTPSTTAFDSISLRKKTAVAAYDIPARLYEPLPLLRDLSGWKNFLTAALNEAQSPSLEAQIRDFKDRVCLPGDAAERIAERITLWK